MASRVRTEPGRAAPPSSCPVTSAQWAQCVPAASSAGGNYSCMGRHFILPELSSSPEGLFFQQAEFKKGTRYRWQAVWR